MSSTQQYEPKYQAWREKDFSSDIAVMRMTPHQRLMYRSLCQRAFYCSTRPDLPTDDQELCDLADADDVEHWLANKKAVMRKFILDGDVWYSKRLRSDWNEITSGHDEAIESGRKGGQSTAKVASRSANGRFEDQARTKPPLDDDQATLEGTPSMHQPKVKVKVNGKVNEESKESLLATSPDVGETPTTPTPRETLETPRPTLVRKKSVGNSFLPKWDEQSNSPDLKTSSKTSTPVKFDPLNFKEPIGDDPVKEVRRVMFYCFKEMEDAYWRKNIPTREDLIRAYPAMKKQVPNDFVVSGQWYREIRVVNPDCPICQGVGDTFIDHPSYTSGMALLGIECDCVTYQEPVWKR
jgi:uncharacterized protein YdaU (DUF1376 family)